MRLKALCVRDVNISMVLQWSSESSLALLARAIPAQQHRLSPPALHAASVCVHQVEGGGLDGVGGSEGAWQRGGDSEAVNRPSFLEALGETGRGRLVDLLQPAPGLVERGGRAR